MQLRYERKFVPDGLTVAEVQALIRRHPAGFREAYPERAVNNLYLDTPGLRHYHEHLNGLPHRVKIRLRWYEELSGRARQPVLEFKIRHGPLGRKETHPLPNLALNERFAWETLKATLAETALPDAARLQLNSLEPAVANRYRRHYFYSSDAQMRLTVDSALEFFPVRSSTGLLRAIPHQGPKVILELKYNEAHAEDAARVANAFPFRLTRCSKYLLGLECVNGL